jgi:hypothetical protein
MTLKLAKPTGAKLNLRQTYVGTDDPDAAAYIAAVETADGQALETATRVAIHSFVKGCKADGIWPAIKASCILAGARTLSGALVPLVGAAPTNFNFVSGDYNRKTGLVGNGSTKYLNSNRNNNADPQNSQHLACYISSLDTAGWYMGAGIGSGSTSGFARRASPNEGTIRFRPRTSNNFIDIAQGSATGFAGQSRSGATASVARAGGSSSTSEAASEPPGNANILVLTSSIGAQATYSNARLAFYSIGVSLDLALLDARVTTLINAFGAAIP